MFVCDPVLLLLCEILLGIFFLYKGRLELFKELLLFWILVGVTGLVTVGMKSLNTLPALLLLTLSLLV